jgi:Spy/CpxP family protein refolding chaperone
MTDDELRQRILDAHRDDAAPAFAQLTARPRRRRAPLVLLPLAAAAALLILWLRPTPPPQVAEVRIELRDPLAFLLTPPNADVLGRRRASMRLFRVLIPVLLLTAVAHAEVGKNDDPIAARLFPPELIMKHQRELGIDDKQRDAIVAEVQKTQSQLVPLQWQMQGASEQMAKLLDEPKLDEAKVLAQADKIMTIEREFKRAHLGLLIRLRNILTNTQRSRLAELRKEAP